MSEENNETQYLQTFIVTSITLTSTTFFKKLKREVASQRQASYHFWGVGGGDFFTQFLMVLI